MGHRDMTAPQSREAEVVAVVLNWNNFDDSDACIRSLLAVTYPRLRIVLVDNRSTDGSFARLKESHPTIQFVANTENLGFSRGCNNGIRAALSGGSCEYVLLINNDCEIDAGALEPAVAEMQAHPDVGVVTAKIVDERGRIWHAGGTISLLRGQSYARGFREPDVGQFETVCDTEWASGALMLVRREVLERVGLLPEEYFFGVEEWDYSLQVLGKGYRVRYVPRFRGMHPGGGSHDNHDPKFAYNYYRNKLIFQERHLGRLLFKLWLLPFLLYLKFKMRRHISYLASITYANPSQSPVDEVVFAAWMAVRDHGTGELNEGTMLRFQSVLEDWRKQRASAQ